MKVAINGLTNDYMQFLRDTWKEQFKDLNIQNVSFQKLDDTKAQEAATKLAETPMSQATKEALDILNNPYHSYPYNGIVTIGKKTTTEMGDRSTIDTPFGEMKIAVKISDDVSVYLDSLAELASFDTNNNGFVDWDDLGANKLVLRGFDESGAEVEFNLLDVLGAVELTQFFNYPKNGIKDSFAAILRPEESHEQLKKENILDFFKTYADKSGWIDFTNPDIAERIFGNNELDLSYRQRSADGTTRLTRISFYDDIERLREAQAEGKRSLGWEYYTAKMLKGAGSDYRFNMNDVGALERLKNGSISYEHESRLRSMNGYHPSDRYDILINDVNHLVENIEKVNMHNGSAVANSLAHTFHDFTGMNYSESNLEKVKEGLARGDMEFLNTLTTQIGNVSYTGGDYVHGMQLNDIAGNITLLFASGNEIKIALEDLYSGNGELNVDADGNRASLMNEAREMSEEDLNNLDFAQVGIKDETGTIVSLKDLGITAIQKATYPDGRFLSFILTNADGAKINAQDLYNIFFVTSGGLESSHKEVSNMESNADSKSALDNANKDSDSLSSKIRKMSNPLVFPNKPSVDVRI
ncbi:MAG: hypothetical protein K2N70_07125 [Helicobacter sp.]|nr:hypothetical protein [Helicobacter sp.]